MRGEIGGFTDGELEMNFDCWMFLLIHLEILDRYLPALQTKIFLEAFELTEIACYTPTKLWEYEGSLKVYRDLINIVNTVLSTETIAVLTGFPLQKIKHLKE